MGKRWLGALLIKNRLHKVQKKKQSAQRARALRRGVRARLRAPVGSRGKTPGGGSGGEGPGSSCAFQ